MAEQQAKTEMTKDRLARMEQEEVELMTKVKRLELHVNSYVPMSSIKELQVAEIKCNLAIKIPHNDLFTCYN